MSDAEALLIELDEEAIDLLNQLKASYASGLLSRAVDAAGGGHCNITAADIRKIAALDGAATDQTDNSGSPASGRDVPGTTDDELSLFRMLLILGLAILMASGVALAAVLIPSVVHNDTSRILIGVAVLGTAALLIGAVGMILARYTTRIKAGSAVSVPTLLGQSRINERSTSASSSSTSAQPAGGTPLSSTSAASPESADSPNLSLAADTGKAAPASPTPPMGSVFELGWLMAQLFGPLQHRRGGDVSTHLPTVSELDPDNYMNLAFLELERLLKPYENLSNADIKAAWDSPEHEGFTAAVQTLHLKILAQFVDDPPQLNAYQLGRALSDTCWLPDEKTGGDFVLREFNRYRLATLQAWLAGASNTLPELSAATVSRSLQNWQDWVDINASAIRDGWATTHTSVVAALRTQASAWHALLAGPTDASGQLSVDAWVHAGQSLLRTTRLLMLTILRRFWLIVVIVAGATGGLLYLAIAYSSGTAKVWTSLVTVAAALGVTGASVRAAATKAAGTIEQDIRNAATLDARAWAATWLPTLPQSRLQKYRLASRGVAVPQAKRGLESIQLQDHPSNVMPKN